MRDLVKKTLEYVSFGNDGSHREQFGNSDEKFSTLINNIIIYSYYSIG